MDLKKELILLSDKLDRAGLTSEADLIDLTLKVAMESKFASILEETFVDNVDENKVEAEKD